MATRGPIEEYFLDMAAFVATRSTCAKRQVGCVIVKDRQVVATGYNGSLPGQPHCTDSGCLLDGYGKCIRTVHAELNALLQCAKFGQSSDGCMAYVTRLPCRNCCMALVQAGVKEVWCSIDFNDTSRKSAVEAAVALTEGTGLSLYILPEKVS